MSTANSNPAARVDIDRILRDLSALIEFPSVTGDEEPIQDLIAGWLREMGVTVESQKLVPSVIAEDSDWPGAEVERQVLPLVVGRVGPRGGKRRLLIGHVDVVPAGDVASWSHSPWKATLEGDQLFGRGAADMKSGCAAILETVRVLTSSGAASAWDGELVVVFVPSEEDGGQGALAAVRAGWTGDAAVIAEPTDLDLVVAHAGAITFRIVVTGRSAHAATRHLGVSALDKLLLVLEALRDDERQRNVAEREPLMRALELPYATSIGVIRGGSWASTVMDEVSVEGRYSVRLGQTWIDAEAELRACVSSAAQLDPWLSDHPPLVAVIGGRFSSARIPGDHPLVVDMRHAIRQITDREPTIRALPAGTDMRLFVNQGQTPTVVFGPGSVDSAHAPDEHVNLTDVATCAKVLVEWVNGGLRSSPVNGGG